LCGSLPSSEPTSYLRPETGACRVRRHLSCTSQPDRYEVPMLTQKCLRLLDAMSTTVASATPHKGLRSPCFHCRPRISPTSRPTRISWDPKYLDRESLMAARRQPAQLALDVWQHSVHIRAFRQPRFLRQSFSMRSGTPRARSRSADLVGIGITDTGSLIRSRQHGPWACRSRERVSAN
jgi:hypothetical protein